MNDQIYNPINRPSLVFFKNWLNDDITTNTKYWHILYTEDEKIKKNAIKELRTYFNSIHEPVKKYLRNIISDDLHPFKINSKDDPAYGYPHMLENITLQGYFGEILTGIFIENNELFSITGWEVPMHIFQTHTVAIQHLEEIKQTKTTVRKLPGHTGEDCIGFKRNEEGKIIKIIFGESKCTQAHNATLIKENHEKLNNEYIKPVNLKFIIEGLKPYEGIPEINDWLNSLKDLYLSRSKIERCNLSCYLCGQKPIRNATWIDKNRPHSVYKSKRQLTSLEVHLNDVENIVKSVYK